MTYAHPTLRIRHAKRKMGTATGAWAAAVDRPALNKGTCDVSNNPKPTYQNVMQYKQKGKKSTQKKK